MRDRLGPAEWENWIDPLRLASIQRHNHAVTVTLRAPGTAHARIVNERYAANLRVALAEALSVTTNQLTLEIGTQP